MGKTENWIFIYVIDLLLSKVGANLILTDCQNDRNVVTSISNDKPSPDTPSS